MAYNSYKNNGSSIDELMKTLFTIITLTIGYVHYLISVKEYSPLFFVYLSLVFFCIIVLYGLFSRLPKDIPYLNPQVIYDRYYKVDMTAEEFNTCLAQLIANITEDTITIHNIANKLGKKLRAMQFWTIIGLIFLALSLLEYLV